jgi:hypothetical protein
MPSNSLQAWRGFRSDSLDEIENAHAMVGGPLRGRRYATEQINHAYCTLLSSQFQGFCRDLHSECVDYIVDAMPLNLQAISRSQYTWGRTLDKGNPNPGNLGSDFNRLGVSFWPAVKTHHAHNERRHDMLEGLNAWRNAIAHQDFDPAKLGGTTVLRLAGVTAWRSGLNGLAASFDHVMREYLQGLLGAQPWT